MLHMMFENINEKYHIKEWQITVLSFLLSVNSKRWEHSTERSRMLAIHILYVMYELKCRSLRLLKDSLPST
jgi:hypothetical protein